MVKYVRGNFFAGEDFIDLSDAQARAETWCADKAGQRIHGTTCARPAVVFAGREAAQLLPAPTQCYQVPIYAQVKVHRDYHVQIGKALYSIPEHLRGQTLSARADGELVKMFHRRLLGAVAAKGMSTPAVSERILRGSLPALAQRRLVRSVCCETVFGLSCTPCGKGCAVRRRRQADPLRHPGLSGQVAQPPQDARLAARHGRIACRRITPGVL
jgi:hypothetical protein